MASCPPVTNRADSTVTTSSDPPNAALLNSSARQPPNGDGDVDRGGLGNSCCCHSTAALSAELQQLREEHQRTLTVLEKLYVSQEALKEVTMTLMGDSIMQQEDSEMEEEEVYDDQGMEQPVTHHPFVRSPLAYNADFSSSDKDLPPPDEVLCSDSDDTSLSDMEGGCSEHDKENGCEVIDHMWDDFSIARYATRVELPCPDRPATATTERRWSPRITIPRPFSMVAREENRTKKKSRSLQMAEKEKLEREAEEEAILKRKFRANPVPATSLLPLYDLICAENEKRRREIKATSQKVLKATERPFSFIAREREKRRDKEQQCQAQVEEEAIRSRQDRTFRARSVPESVSDSKVDERLKEQESYRDVTIKVRAHDMLARSKLPPNMRFKGREYTIGALRRKRYQQFAERAFLTTEHQFHPSVNPTVPDYEQPYLALQEELMERKQSNHSTTPQPFTLHTEQRASIRDETIKQAALHKSPVQKPLSPKINTSPVPSIPLTRSAKLRQQSVNERLSMAAEQEEAQEALLSEQQEIEKVLRREVTLRSAGNDLTPWLEKRQRENQQLLRKAELVNEGSYQQHLEEINQRVAQRPLLFERNSPEKRGKLLL